MRSQDAGWNRTHRRPAAWERQRMLSDAITRASGSALILQFWVEGILASMRTTVPPTVSASDPVAIWIERNLRSMHANGGDEFVVKEARDGVRLQFGRSKAKGENYDIALIRLANRLLEDQNNQAELVTRMRGYF